MDSLIYSLTATVPVFLVIVLGHVLRRIGLLDGGFVTVSNAFNFRVTLPVLLFCDMAGSHLREEFDVRLVLFCATVTTVMFFAIWFLARLLLRDKSLVGAFVQACCRSSVAVLGLAFHHQYLWKCRNGATDDPGQRPSVQYLRGGGARLLRGSIPARPGTT